MMLNIKRVYSPAKKADGFRVLVDRLWPRGISKQKAKVDLWLKEIAPSNELRKWFSHDPAKWIEFKRRYKNELKKNNAMVKKLKKITREHAMLTILFGAKDEVYNNAVVLKELLK